MAAPTQPTVPPAAFVDGAMGYGSRYELFYSGTLLASAYLAWFCLESINISHPNVGGNRPNPIGGPNGFWIVEGQDTMSCKAQLPLANTAPLKIGNFFTDAFALPGTPVIGGPSTGGTLEIWVIETAGEKYEMAGYWYQDLTLKKASAIAFTPPA